MDRKDRGEIDNLHTFSASASGRRQQQAPNHRDASSSSQSHSGPWKNEATPISVPKAFRDENVKRNNLWDESRPKPIYYSNPTAQRTILKTHDPTFERGAKRTRLDSTSKYSSRRVIPNTVSGSSHDNHGSRQKSTLRKSFPPAPHNVIHISDDDDTDTGQIVPRYQPTLEAPPTSSPDPLMLDPARRVVPQEPHPFDGLSYPQDSDLKELREKNRTQNQTGDITLVLDSEPEPEPEEIEQFSDPTPGPSKKRKLSQPPENLVRDTVQALELQNKCQEEPSRQEKTVQRLDLKMVSRSSGSVASKMKPKGLPPGPDFKSIKPKPEVDFVNDPITAPSLGPSSTKSKKATKFLPSTPKCTFMLPLEAWTYGHTLFKSNHKERYLFCLDESENKILIRSASSEKPFEEFGLHKTTIENITLTNTDSDDPKLRDSPIIRIVLGHDYSQKGLRDPSVQFRKYIKLGSKRGGSELTFKFLRDSNEDQRNHDKWRDSEYQQMLSFLRRLFQDTKKLHVVTPAGANSLWQAAQNAASVMAQRGHANAISPPPDSTNNPTVRPRPRPRPRFSDNDEVMEDVEPPRRSTRTTSQKGPSADPDELILVYPSSGPGAINITRGDLNRLEDGEYLNDTLIEFGLKLWLSDLRETDPDLADQIHVFSSFFYKKLRNGKVEDSYQSVRKWTQKFDIFKKSFLIVPINEHLHWYLAIIFRPHHVLQPPPVLPPHTPSVSTRGRKHKETEIFERAVTASKADVAETREEPDPVSPSDGQGQEEVEEMFQSSCSISSAQSEQSSDTESSNGDAVMELAEGDSMIIDVARISPELGYPAEVESSHSASMEIDRLEEDPASSEPTSRAHSLKAISTVASTSFYASTVPQNKGKEQTVFQSDPLDLSDSDKGEHQEVTDLLDESEPSEITESTTFIFTLDSLGSRHIAAVNSLKLYLKLEAKDKLGVSEASDARGFQAFVPIQPNYCDCGLYLLHFAKTFVKRPDHHCKTILTRKKRDNLERQEEWEYPAVATSRQDLKRRIEELSEVWKNERAAKQGQVKQDGDKTESSDSEIDIVEDTTTCKAGKKPKATRIRG